MRVLTQAIEGTRRLVLMNGQLPVDNKVRTKKIACQMPQSTPKSGVRAKKKKKTNVDASSRNQPAVARQNLKSPLALG